MAHTDNIQVFAELATSAIIQDLFGGFSGIDSFAGYLADMTANRWGLLALLVIVAILNKRLVCFVRSLTGTRPSGRRGSGATVSKPAISIAAILVCITIGAYHIFGQILMMRAATTKSTGVKLGSLSAAMDSAE